MAFVVLCPRTNKRPPPSGTSDIHQRAGQPTLVGLGRHGGRPGHTVLYVRSTGMGTHKCCAMQTPCCFAQDSFLLSGEPCRLCAYEMLHLPQPPLGGRVPRSLRNPASSHHSINACARTSGRAHGRDWETGATRLGLLGCSCRGRVWRPPSVRLAVLGRGGRCRDRLPRTAAHATAILRPNDLARHARRVSADQGRLSLHLVPRTPDGTMQYGWRCSGRGTSYKSAAQESAS